MKSLVLSCDCDECEAVEEYDTVEEAHELGSWWILTGPARFLGGTGERVYCSQECLEADIC